MESYPPPPNEQRAVDPVIFDPPGDALTTATLRAVNGDLGPMLNNYVRRVKVGGGQHGDVYLCHRLDTRLAENDPGRRISVAMKSVKRNNPRAEQMRVLRRQRIPATDHLPLADNLNTTEAKIRKEIAIMKKLRHPHVVRLFEVIDDRMKEKIYMVMEYLGGGEVKWRDDDSNPILTVAQTRRILRDAVLGLEYLHYQGIIHRDIKPANLLWTEDRRQVKIGDFGVSHFSYAQRLAAAGGTSDPDDPYDPILLDDSSLTRRAGTPSFLAPEVIWEHTNELPPSASNSTTNSPDTTSTSRPQITKSIDIWALGVTLYCLLFGRTPFVPEKGASGVGTEYNLYNTICNDDWDVPSTMGADRLPTGGRHPDPDSPGASIIHLLDHFLQKDYMLRITLDEVKLPPIPGQTTPWLLEDLDDPMHWLRVTSPTSPRINVSMNEASDAMSVVHFRWRWGNKLVKQVSSLLTRTVRLPTTAASTSTAAVRSAGASRQPSPRYTSPGFVLPGPSARGPTSNSNNNVNDNNRHHQRRGGNRDMDRTRPLTVFSAGSSGGEGLGVGDGTLDDTTTLVQDPSVGVGIRRNRSAPFRQGEGGSLDLSGLVTAPAPLGQGSLNLGRKDKGKERERVGSSPPSTTTTLVHARASTSTWSSRVPSKPESPPKASKPKQVRSEKSLRTKSTDGYPGVDKHGHSASSSALPRSPSPQQQQHQGLVQGSGSKPRRGSDVINNLFERPRPVLVMNPASAGARTVVQPVVTPVMTTVTSRTTSGPGHLEKEKKAARFTSIFQGFTNWRGSGGPGSGSKNSAPSTPLSAHHPTSGRMGPAGPISTPSSSGAASPVLSPYSSSYASSVSPPSQAHFQSQQGQHSSLRSRTMPSATTTTAGPANYPEAYAKKALAAPTPQPLQQGMRRSEEALRYYRPNMVRREYLYDVLDEASGMGSAPASGAGAAGGTRQSEAMRARMVSGSGTESGVDGEQVYHHRLDADFNDDDLEGPSLTAARRASSWGQGDRELTEVVSVTSLDHQLNDHDMFVGAGGVGKLDEQDQHSDQRNSDNHPRQPRQQGAHQYQQHHYHNYRTGKVQVAGAGGTVSSSVGGGGGVANSASGSGSSNSGAGSRTVSSSGGATSSSGGNASASAHTYAHHQRHGHHGPTPSTTSSGIPSSPGPLTGGQSSSSAIDIEMMWNYSSSPIAPQTPPSPHSAARFGNPLLQLRRESTFDDDDGDEEFGKPLMMAVGGGRGLGGGALGGVGGAAAAGAGGGVGGRGLGWGVPEERIVPLRSHHLNPNGTGGSIFDEDEDEQPVRDEEEDEVDDEDGDDEDGSSSEQEHHVTFSPRRRPQHVD